ncbi:unnamed protein product [Ectocarpus sp. 13 AM-2016]
MMSGEIGARVPSVNSVARASCKALVDSSRSNSSNSSNSSSGGRTDDATRDALREANRLHCKETRQRKRKQEQLLREEVSILELCKSIVEHGPDLFSVHGFHTTAPFRFLCEDFCDRLQMEPAEFLGRPLASIVDPQDADVLENAVARVLDPTCDSTGTGTTSTWTDSPDRAKGCLIDVRVTRHGLSCPAEMSISMGSHGLVVVTRLYRS